MYCPICLYPDSKVIDSRAVDDGIRRRRECLGCGERFTTYERVLKSGVFVVKKDGRREEFSREKVLGGLRKACEKRPLAAGVLEAVTDDIEAQAHALGFAEVASERIGGMVMRHLRELDQVAYIRFASVYRAFTDVESIVREIEALERTVIPPADQLPLLSEQDLAEVDQHPSVRPLRRARGGRRQEEAL